MTGKASWSDPGVDALASRDAQRPAGQGSAAHGRGCLVRRGDRDEAELLLTELVANGVRHAGSSLDVRLTVEHNPLRAEVRDGSSLAPLPRAADEHGGRGVLILDALASRWGVLGHPGAGKTVWFELADSATLARPGASSSLERGPRLLESN